MSANANPSMPQDNPVLKLYTDWSERTPYVTRGSMIVLVVAYILSFFFSADLALGNIPYFTIFYFEIYRPVLSPLVGNSILTLILICFFYPSMGKRIEDSIGSSGFLFLLGTLSLLVNGIFLAICMVLYTLGQGDALFYSCSGFWTVIFALLTMECMLSPDAPKRMLLIPVDIPSKYFPLVLYGFFCLFSGLQLSFAISIGVGYAYHKGYLDKLRVSSYYLESLETNGGVLHGISRSRGWILSGAALGHDAWVALNSGQVVEAPANNSSAPSAGAGSRGNVMGLGNFMGGGASANDGESGGSAGKKDTFSGPGNKLGGSAGPAATLFGGGANDAGLDREALAKKRLDAMKNNNNNV